MAVMPGSPLQPFSAPAFLGGAANAAAVANWLFVAVLVYWAGYTAVALYHWYWYSHQASVARPAVAIHLGVSAVFFILILSGLV